LDFVGAVAVNGLGGDEILRQGMGGGVVDQIP
jgi:hypothetical protein